MVKAKWAAGIGLRECWRGSELNGHPRGHEHEPRTEGRVCREDARCVGREVVVVAVVVESSSRSAQLCHRVTHMHAHRESGEEKQTRRVTPVKKAVKNAPDMQVTLPRCMNAMAIHCGAPITATRLSPIIPMATSWRGPYSTPMTPCWEPSSLPVGQRGQQRAGTAQAKGDGPLV